MTAFSLDNLVISGISYVDAATFDYALVEKAPLQNSLEYIRTLIGDVTFDIIQKYIPLINDEITVKDSSEEAKNAGYVTINLTHFNDFQKLVKSLITEEEYTTLKTLHNFDLHPLELNIPA